MQRTDGFSASQTDRVVLALRELVLRGEFSPGTRLTELGLVPRLQASRTPVRHALVRLADEGLLEPTGTSGFRVRAFTLTDLWDAIELRGVLEGTAVRLAAERLQTPDALALARLHLTAMDALLPLDKDRFLTFLEANE